MSPSDHPVTRRFIEEAGNTTQALGVGRVVGQIYAFLYFRDQPATLDAMKDALGISKGSASMGVRQLEQWGAVQQVWVKGDRKDYYTANDYFGHIVRNLLADLMGKRLSAMAQALEEAEKSLDAGEQAAGTGPHGAGQGVDHLFMKDRIKRLRAFQQKVNKARNNPLVKLLLK